MIHVVFISPDAFEKLARQLGEQDGLSDLRELLFPRRSEPNVMVADPHQKNWFKEISQRVWRLPPQSRDKARKLLERLHEQSLVGWTSSGSSPTSEGDWIKLVGSDKRRIVDCTFASDASFCGKTIESVDRISDDTWLREHFPWSKTIPRCRSGQLPVFQKLLLGCDWCITELPYIKGGETDEVVTLKQLVDVIRDLPRKSLFELDLIIERRDELVFHYRNLATELREALKGYGGIKLRVFALPKCLDRYFTVGRSSTIAGGQSKRQVRRCIAAQHVAIGRDRPGESSTWSLCNSVDTQARFDKLQSDMATPGALVFELP